MTRFDLTAGVGAKTKLDLVDQARQFKEVFEMHKDSSSINRRSGVFLAFNLRLRRSLSMTNSLSFFSVLLSSSLFLAACGSQTAFHTVGSLISIGGTLINLSGAGNAVQLQNDGGDTITVNANGAFTFPTKLASGTAYKITIFKQPSAPAQTCGVTNDSGTATSDVSNVAVDCGHNEWTWVGGSNISNQPGIYGTLGQAASGNVPGPRTVAVAWTDKSGNVWVFGGFGGDSTGAWNSLNDLWKYSGGDWTWMNGSNLGNQPGKWGTQGTAAPDNVPSARNGMVGWTDTVGDIWLFGGNGVDSSGSGGWLNDLWRYDGTQWTWMGGSSLASQWGTYGVQGTPAAANTPGAREGAATWTDTSGNFWLFGGLGVVDSSGTHGYLNDLWKYSGGQWTWIAGPNAVGQAGVYGTLGTAAPSNLPGARSNAACLVDASGNVWLFGGKGLDSTGAWGFLNDLWKYSGGEWTWISGSNLINQQGVFGTQGTPAASNVPAARNGAVAWIDAARDFWLFSGQGRDPSGPYERLNDLWKYNGGQWTWMGGGPGQSATYGTLGTPAPGNLPGVRQYAVSWSDENGNLWLFSGDAVASDGNLLPNDLWKYEP